MLDDPSFHPASIAVPKVRDYSRRHGYGFLAPKARLNSAVPWAWNKLYALQQVLQMAKEDEWVTWIDSDVLLLDAMSTLESKLSGLVTKDTRFVFSSDQSGLCTGFFLVRKSPIISAFLSDVFEHYTDVWPWEQQAVKEVLATRTIYVSATALIPESVIQNPRSAFNFHAFAMHFWSSYHGQERVSSFMRLVGARGWNHEIFLQAQCQ